MRIGNPMFSNSNIENVNNMLDEFEGIAQKYNINVLQLSLAWTYHRVGITHLLCGARTVEQTLSNAKAGDVELSVDDIKQMNSIYKKYLGD